MFVARGRGRIVYKVLESYREGGKTRKRHIAFLGSHPTVEAAYGSALKDYLIASDNVYCICNQKGLKVARNGSQGAFKERRMKAVRDCSTCSLRY